MNTGYVRATEMGYRQSYAQRGRHDVMWVGTGGVGTSEVGGRNGTEQL